MISISEAVEQTVKRSPFIEEGLRTGIINYSGYARFIKSEIENKTFKEVTEGSILMALKRLNKGKKTTYKNIEPKELIMDMTVRSNIAEYTFLKSDKFLAKQADFFTKLSRRPNLFISVGQGVFETTIIVSDLTEVRKLIEECFANEKILHSFFELSSITIKLAEDNVKTPGLYYLFLKTLAWEGINIMEIVSTSNEVTIVFESKDINRAFEKLNALKST